MSVAAYVRPGHVQWTGDNPFIYLSSDGTPNAWATLALWFRVTTSPQGTGFVALVVEAPYEPPTPALARLCLTDNESLADALLERYVSRFPLFRSVDLATVTRLPDASAATDTDGRTWWTSVATSPDGRTAAAFAWKGVSEQFAVAVPAEHSATGSEEMMSVFAPAASASVAVNGRPLPGLTVERDFFGRRAQSAALAFSETWILPVADESALR
jgi:hypothetical protein